METTQSYRTYVYNKWGVGGKKCKLLNANAINLNLNNIIHFDRYIYYIFRSSNNEYDQSTNNNGDDY